MKKLLIISSVALVNFLGQSVLAQSVNYTTDNQVNKLAPIKIGASIWFAQDYKFRRLNSSRLSF
jgi:hypothetical protein